MKRSVDMPLLLSLCVLVVFGLLIFTSAALGLLARDGATFSSVAVNQLLLGLLCGSIALVVLSRIDYKLWRPYTLYFFVGALILTLLTFVPHVGLSLKGASRWIALGPLSFQPVELLKFAAILFLAALYAPHMKQVQSLKGGLVPLFITVGISGAVVLLQPDTASAMMLIAAGVAVFFAAGGRFRHLVLLGLVGVVILAGAAFAYPHVKQRLLSYIHPSADTQGAGYQTDQSLIAIGSGGLTGRGFGQSIEKFSYLPEPIGDSIFAVAGEEFGFIGSALLVLLYAAFALLGLRIAARAPDPFGGLICVGLVVLIVGQSLFNIASATALVPLVGVPLIFVSHGGTALAIALAEVGVLLSVSRRMKS